MRKKIKVGLVISGVLVSTFFVGCVNPAAKMCRQYDNTIGNKYDDYVTADTTLTPDEKKLALKSHQNFRDALHATLDKE